MYVQYALSLSFDKYIQKKLLKGSIAMPHTSLLCPPLSTHNMLSPLSHTRAHFIFTVIIKIRRIQPDLHHINDSHTRPTTKYHYTLTIADGDALPHVVLHCHSGGPSAVTPLRSLHVNRIWARFNQITRLCLAKSTASLWSECHGTPRFPNAWRNNPSLPQDNCTVSFRRSSTGFRAVKRLCACLLVNWAEMIAICSRSIGLQHRHVAFDMFCAVLLNRYERGCMWGHTSKSTQDQLRAMVAGPYGVWWSRSVFGSNESLQRNYWG